MTRRTLCVIQPFDPRGRKIGGIESHIREVVRSAPDDMQVLLIGIDEVGDLKLGELQTATFEGKPYQVFPLLARTGDSHLHAAKKLTDSLTLNFFFAFLKNLPKLRRIVKPLRASAEIQRFEYATFGKLLGVPTVQLVHGEGRPDQPMDSLLKRYWFINEWNERITLHAATRIVGVNPRIVERIKEKFPFAAAKSQMMTVSVNTDIFALAPEFPPVSPFRIVFAGRLDAFKRPDLIFRAVHELRTRHGVDAEFNYIGGSDATAIPEFDLIKDSARLYGVQKAAGVAQLLGEMHTGILVSEFEGMPVFVLELLAVGRPLTALELPQLELVVEPGVSGAIVKRSGDVATDVSAVAEALAALKDKIAAGGVDPAAIRHRIEPFSHRTQMKRLFDLHRSLQADAMTGEAAHRPA